jgi:hypothetical protein
MDTIASRPVRDRRSLRASSISRYFKSTASLLLALSTASAHAFTTSYNFDNVTADAASTVDVCQTTCPGSVVAGLPSGTDGVRATSGGSAAHVNIRNQDNAINAVDAAAPDTVFNGFFSTGSAAQRNNFLVLGDDDGAIFGTGTVSPGSGQSYIRLPFFVDPGTTQVGFSFDFAFNGTDTSATLDDVFTAKVTNAGGTTTPLVLFSRSSAAGFTSQHLSALDLPTWIPNVADTGTTWWLEFELVEAGTGTQSAIGIDNVSIGDVTVSSVPVPAPLALLGSALCGFPTVARRRSARGS